MNDMKLPFDDVVDLSPADDRLDPAVWVRRVIIVERREPGAEVIRKVEFRRGLNIIATAEPNPEVDRPVGHNVGKTLLTRLIRYCLGEQHYAKQSVCEAIAHEWPEAFIVAEISLGDQPWVVVRPIGDASQSDSACLRGSSWRAILDPTVETERFSCFVEEVENATVANFAETSLPHSDRAVQWRDLLAWLSRDQYCRYRHPLEWRTPWTESGTAGLNDEDASVLIRLVHDLLDEEELKLIKKHKRLLAGKATKSAEVKSINGARDRTRRFLEDRLDLTGELLSDDLFGEAARTQAQEKCGQIEHSIKELDIRFMWWPRGWGIRRR